MNQLLSKNVQDHVIDFSTLKAQDFAQAFNILMPAVREEFEFIVTKAPLTYDALFESDEKAKHLTAVLTLLSSLYMMRQEAPLREVYEEYMPKVTEFLQELGLDKRAYDKMVQYTQTAEYKTLNPLRIKAIQDMLFNYEIGGIALPQEQKQMLQDISVALTRETTKFDNNLVDTYDELVLEFSKEELAGLPERALENIKLLDNGKYEATYLAGNFNDIMDYCCVESTRRAVYEAELGIGTFEDKDNRDVVKEITRLKQAKAKILNFETYAHMGMVKEMVKSPQEALSFIENLAQSSHPKAIEEWKQVEEFGKKFLGREMMFWDRAFVLEAYKKTQFNLDPEAQRQYFPVSAVLPGLFKIVSTLYGVQLVQNTSVSTWHEDVLVYDVNKSGHYTGRLYIDLFKREGKEDGAWMMNAVDRSVTEKQTRLPVAYIVCNVIKDVKRESTFIFDEIVTLFHEMGHALHHLLSTVDEEYFSGLNQVEHDAIELPSQFMENFVWDYEVLKVISRHTQTTEVFPLSEYQKLLNSKYFLAAHAMVRQAAFSELDMRIYSNPEANPLDVEKNVFKKWETIKRDERASFVPTFSHIFSGGYAAGYYAYKWAEVLSSDCFAALKESGQTYVEQVPMAKRFLKTILSRGGTQDMLDNFIEFRGRAPDVTFLLRDYGIIK